MQPATIKLFLATGKPDGLRTAEISNWTGKAIACPRSDIQSLLERPESGSTGIYFLQGIDSDTDLPALYIGEAEVVKKRIKSHLAKDYWTTATIVISKDDNLTKAHVRYLEGLLIQKASGLRGIVLVNGASSGAKLPEPEQAEMDIFLDKVYQLLPVMGLNIFKSNAALPKSNKATLYLKIKGLAAKGIRTSNGFIVFKDSQAVLEHRPSAKRAKLKREKLVEQGVLTIDGDHYRFTEDYEFSSPSSAGTVVSGGATNGLTAWRNRDGVPLKELELAENKYRDVEPESYAPQISKMIKQSS